MQNKYSRRKFVGASVAVLATGSLGLLSSRFAHAADMPHVDPEAAQPKALKYVHESTVNGSKCANCQLYSGEAGADWGPCGIFPGQQVSANGWCSAWSKKAG